MAAELDVVMVTSAVCPSRSVLGGSVRVMVVAYVTTELLAVAVGAMAVTFAADVALAMAGKVILATWPTLTLEMSDSLSETVIVIVLLSMISAKPEPEAVLDEPEEPEPDELAALAALAALELEPEPEDDEPPDDEPPDATV